MGSLIRPLPLRPCRPTKLDLDVHDAFRAIRVVAFLMDVAAPLAATQHPLSFERALRGVPVLLAGGAVRGQSCDPKRSSHPGTDERLLRFRLSFPR